MDRKSEIRLKDPVTNNNNVTIVTTNTIWNDKIEKIELNRK